jgi:predicted transcriptional regulator YdeE
MNNSVRFETIGPIDLMGVVIYGNPDIVPFHQAWEHFGKIADEASISRIGKDLFGLQIYSPWFEEKHEITYMACIEKPVNFQIPIRLLSKTLPRCKYVIQKVEGGINGIDQNLKFLYEDYIPNNGLKIAFPYDFEKYCDIDSHDSLSNQIEIWVPIS